MSVVLVDLDGPIADFEGAVYRAFTGSYPLLNAIDPQDRRGFSVAEHYRAEFGEDSYRKILNIIKSPHFYRSFPEVEGAAVGLKTLMTNFASVWICTAPSRVNQECIADKVEWVRDQLGAPWVERLVITRDKTMIRADYLIDDKPKIQGCMMPTWEHLVFDAPYNRGGTNRRFSWGLMDWLIDEQSMIE